MEQDIKFIIAQFNAVVGDIEGNTNRIIDIIVGNRELNCTKIFVFPELALCGYLPEDLLFRSDFTAAVNKAINKITSVIEGNEYLVLGAPSYSNDNTQIWNSAYIINNKHIQHIYNKQILPNYGVFDEKRYFSSGDKNLILDIEGNRICIMVCEDLWGYSSLYEKELDGIDFLISLNASPYENKKNFERIDFFKEISIKYKFNLVYVNTVGGQDEIVFDGSSFLLDRYGNLIHHCKKFSEEVYRFSISKKEFSKAIIKTHDKNHNQYEYLYEALKLGTYDYIRKSNFNGVLLGLSGGIDSALTLAIASDVFEKENIEAVLLPSVYTSDLSILLAEEQCNLLGIKHTSISIKDINDIINSSLEHRFFGLQKDVTEENIQARIRGLLLMAISNKSGKLLLTTGNKSELAVGYSTLYGDMSGSFAPLKDIYKTEVYGLATYRNSLSVVVPEAVIDRMPTAELSYDQYDIDTLPQYDILDIILKSFIENERTLDEICIMGYEKNLVTNIINMVIKNEYKRRQYAPGVKVSSKSFGRDRRFPIVSRFKY
tara:strand:- start:1519 stop:3150 length:1632 start_codon:yes stop_codon:yes gene_type:complete